MNWQPIETAPTDHKINILIWSHSDGMHVGYFDNRYKSWQDSGGRSVEGVTHWMPLPQPPI